MQRQRQLQVRQIMKFVTISMIQAALLQVVKHLAQIAALIVAMTVAEKIVVIIALPVGTIFVKLVDLINGLTIHAQLYAVQGVVFLIIRWL